MKGKMAIIGDGDSILVFKAIGMDAYSAASPEKARELLHTLSKKYQIIYVTDVLAKEIDDTISRFVESPYPVVIPVPSMNGSNGYGFEILKRETERALGIDILSQEEKKNEQ
jgi:ATP synthase, subunit F